VYDDYKPTSQGKRPRGEQTGSETFFVAFRKQIPAQTAVPMRSEAAVPAPSAEAPPAAEQTPETEPQTGWQWLNTSNVGLFAGASSTRSRLGWRPRPRRPLDQAHVCCRLRALVKVQLQSRRRSPLCR
jgi:hypothetical protein